ncbi:MAG: hypothetical protein GYB66_03515 [Chloroflexi bacterium]|nr:hypothetical protein [Chloroflexota bacterium]
MEVVENQTFRSETITVDDTQFKNCLFDNASLVYAGGALPSFVDCQFRSVSLQFTAAAANTLEFLGGLRRGGFAPAVDKIINGVRNQQY